MEGRPPPPREADESRLVTWSTAFQQRTARSGGHPGHPVGLSIGLHILTVRANRSRPVRLAMTDGLLPMAPLLLGLGYLGFGQCMRFWRVEPAVSTDEAG